MTSFGHRGRCRASLNRRRRRTTKPSPPVEHLRRQITSKPIHWSEMHASYPTIHIVCGRQQSPGQLATPVVDLDYRNTQLISRRTHRADHTAGHCYLQVFGAAVERSSTMSAFDSARTGTFLVHRMRAMSYQAIGANRQEAVKAPSKLAAISLQGQPTHLKWQRRCIREQGYKA